MNQVKKMLMVGLFALGCGAGEDGMYAEPYEELGTLEQPIYMPLGYGSEDGGSNYRCDENWSGGKCAVPDNRTPGFTITQNCWDVVDDMGAQFKLALNYAKGVVNSSPLSWNMSWGLTGDRDFSLQCITGTSGSPMKFSPNGLTADCHDTPRGDLCQFKTGTIEIRPGVIRNTPGWANATDVQRGRMVNNMLRHEIGHVLGLGHVPNDQSKLMSRQFTDDPNYPGTDPWNNLLTFDATEVNALDCYNESSSTNPRC